MKMRTIFAGLAIVAMPAALLAAPNPARTVEQLQKAAIAARESKCKESLKLVSPLLPDAITTLPEEAQAAAYDLAVLCALQMGKVDDAYRDILRASPLPKSSDYVWRMRLAIELDAGRDDAALTTIEEMTQGHGRALNDIPPRWFWQLHTRLRGKENDARRERLFKIMADNAYQPTEPLASTEGFRYRYATLLTEKGQLEPARALLETIRGPTALSDILFDPRLRAVRPREIDLRQATEAELTRYREARLASPRLLLPILGAAENLRRLGRAQESIDTLKAVESKMSDSEGFDDFGERHEWWWDALGRGFAALGKYDEAAASFRKGAALNEGGQLNVSQTINLAEMQNSFGRYEAALATLAAFDDPKRKGSPYGESEMRFARGCAAAKFGRKAQAEADLAYLVGHEGDHPEALSDLLLCRGEIDKAAAAFIRRLDDPERRVDALQQLSDYDAPIVPRLTDFMTMGLSALKARSDIKEAVARAGATQRIPLQAPGL